MLGFKLDFVQETQSSPSSPRYKWRLPETQKYTETTKKNPDKLKSCRQSLS